MSKCDVLYVKGMKTMSESEVDEEEVWDDTKLNAAYDKALRMANSVEVAQRVAMATNSHYKDVTGDKYNKPAKSYFQNKQKKCQWKPKMSCRAIYEGDGQEYEAIVQRLINDHECIVRFIGYDNSEIVPIELLQPSKGKQFQDMQRLQALHEKEDEEEDITVKMDMGSDGAASPASTVIVSDRPQDRRKKSAKKKKNDKLPNGFTLPSVPMPNMSILHTMGLSEMPVPPPPPTLSGRVDSEEQALSSMLLSWYMSGYYAGLYQGLKRSKENRKNSH